MHKSYSELFLNFGLENKKKIKFFFKIIYLCVIILWVIGMLQARNGRYELLGEVGRSFGAISAILFCVTILPGILRRFRISNPIMALLMMFRRQLGVTTFLFGWLHYSFLRLFLITFGEVSWNYSSAIFEIFGSISLFFMALLFMTSNDWSVKHLGIWWRRIHNLVYIIAWTIFLHVFIQQLSPIAILIGFFAFAEVLSLIFYQLKSSKINSNI